MATRSFLASLVCSIVLVACGDDGGGNNTGDDGGDDGVELCGNGNVDGAETCDDRNAVDNDGCTSCQTDTGYTCTGAPSVCTMGGSVIENGTCAAPYVVALTDDGAGGFEGTATGTSTVGSNQVDEASCNGSTVGSGNDVIFSFTLTVASDIFVFGPDDPSYDMVLRVGLQPCDAEMMIPDDFGDGCSDDDPESLSYTALPPGTYYLMVDGYDDEESGDFAVGISTYPTTCGDGVLDLFEECDDGALAPSDGCSGTCNVETGWECDDSEPSVCQKFCGNGVIDFDEECDDGDDVGTDGCSELCEIEPGYACTGTPSTCAMTCGNNIIDAGEECDDGDAVGADGCSDICQVETGYVCAGTPSVCNDTCGNETIDANEECDDGGTTNGDACSDNCQLEFNASESEPNDATPQVITFTPGVDRMVRGSFSSVNDTDLYQFTLTAPSYVELEVYNAIDADTLNYDGVGVLDFIDCIGAIDTTLHLFPQGANYTNDSAAIGSDTDDGDGLCSYIGYNDPLDSTEGMLQAGTYVVRLRNTGGAPVYILDLYVESFPAEFAGDLTINEVMTDPGSNADTNCDTTKSSTQDELVELVNTSGLFLDITGVRIQDLVTARHTFAAGASGRMGLLPGESVVVWSGGTPACPGVTNWFTASDVQGLQLNNNDEELTILPAGTSTTIIDTGMFDGGPTGVSYNRDPDITGTAFAAHNVIDDAVGNYSPGKLSDGTPFLP